MMSLVECIRRFRSVRALVIGDAMLDSYFEGSAARLCSEGPVPVVRHTGEEHLPGGAANSAINLRTMGADVDFLSVVGDDVPGRILRETLRTLDVHDDLLVAEGSARTLHKLRILADDQYVVRFDSGHIGDLSKGTKDALLSRLEAAYQRCDVVVVSDYHYGAMFPELLHRLTDLRRERWVPLIVDSKNLPVYAGADVTVITPNQLEARLTIDPHNAHEGGADPSALEDVGRRLLDLIDAHHAAITMAEEGALLVPRGGSALHVPAHPVARASDVGAGDSFTAALSLAVACGAALPDSVRIGVVAGGIAVTRPRTAAVRQGELLQRASLEDSAAAASVSELSELLRDERVLGRTVVFTNGVFDILHAGHVHFLQRAKELGDVLVVGVNTDAGARRLKGRNRPINSERERAALVAALGPVDHVVLFDEDDPAALIRALRPDVHVKGGDYAGAELPESEAVREVGGRVEIVPLAGDISTSGVIDRIVSLALAEAAGAAR